jgi:predicted ATPase
MGRSIKDISIEGFKSIRKLDNFELKPLNILIGANGAGKSNFVDFFRLLRAMAEENLTGFVNKQGGADGFFYLGPRITSRIQVHLRFGHNQYKFTLEPTASNELLIAEEQICYGTHWEGIGNGQKESMLRSVKDERSRWGHYPGMGHYVHDALSSWTVYHFHDTSALAPVRREQSARDFDYLRPDASNIAAYLLSLKTKQQAVYELIRDTVRLIAPFFDDFVLRPDEKGGEEKVRLEWMQKGSDFPFQPSQLSDGTLRFICLTTALLQPEPPATLVIDEPELGLHPHALEVLAGLLRKASQRMQVVVSTQSAPLLSQFEPADVVVVSRNDGASEFRRLDEGQLNAWLAEYTLGELWQKNYVEGASYG